MRKKKSIKERKKDTTKETGDDVTCTFLKMKVNWKATG